MTIGVNASQARSKSQQDMIIFNETDAIMRAIIQNSEMGIYDAVVDSGTTMTESTPISTLVGTEQNPTVPFGSSIIINGVTVFLGTSGISLNGVIADINDADIPGVTARKENDYLVIDIVHTQQNTWTYEIGAGTANLALGITAGIYAPENPSSIDYFNTWQGVEVNRALVQQMDTVIKHFSNLGFKIERLTNTNTYKTFKWHIYW